MKIIRFFLGGAPTDVEYPPAGQTLGSDEQVEGHTYRTVLGKMKEHTMCLASAQSRHGSHISHNYKNTSILFSVKQGQIRTTNRNVDRNFAEGQQLFYFFVFFTRT